MLLKNREDRIKTSIRKTKTEK